MIRRPPRSTLFPTRRSSDLDATDDPTHGQQEFALFNGYYDTWCYLDRKSTRLNSSHANISYAVFCLKKKNSIGPAAASAATSTSMVPTFTRNDNIQPPTHTS